MNPRIATVGQVMLWLAVALLAQRAEAAGQGPRGIPPARPAVTEAQCQSLPTLDRLLQQINQCETTGPRANRTMQERTCLTWWRGRPTSCIAAPACHGLMAQYYSLLTGMGLRDRNAMPQAATANAVNAQIRNACANQGSPFLITRLRDEAQKLSLPVPIISRIEPASAAPGAIVTLYGRDLNPQGPLVFTKPKIVFAGSPGYSSQTGDVVSNSELRITVPPGNGKAQIEVQTPGGTSNRLPFVYKGPTLTRVTPASGPRGQSVTLIGTGFGVKRSLDSSFVKFGDSLVVKAAEWTDQRIRVIPPNDFGTGETMKIVFGVGGCAASLVTGTPAWETYLLKIAGVPGCIKLFTSTFTRLKLARNPGFVTLAVPVDVHTSAGASNSQTFTYTVPSNTR